MELRELIERAEKNAGSQIALGKMINQAPSTLRAAKAGLQGLPTYACVQIAELINIPAMTVIAASELVTEKKAEKRAIFAPFVKRAASVLIGAVIFNMSPKPANAAAMNAETTSNVYYVKSRRFSRFSRKLKQHFLNTFKIRIPESLRRSWVLRVHHVTT